MSDDMGPLTRCRYPPLTTPRATKKVQEVYSGRVLWQTYKYTFNGVLTGSLRFHELIPSSRNIHLAQTTSSYYHKTCKLLLAWQRELTANHVQPSHFDSNTVRITTIKTFTLRMLPYVRTPQINSTFILARQQIPAYKIFFVPHVFTSVSFSA